MFVSRLASRAGAGEHCMARGRDRAVLHPVARHAFATSKRERSCWALLLGAFSAFVSVGGARAAARAVLTLRTLGVGASFAFVVACGAAFTGQVLSFGTRLRARVA